MEYYSPKTLEELVNNVNKFKSDAAIVAGCTDVLVKENFFDGKKAIIDTTSVKEIKTIEESGNRIRIGSGVTFSNILNSKLIQESHKSLYEAARVYGSLQIRNRGTIAGNIVNASPAADSVPPLIVSNGELILVSEKGEKRVKLENFFTGPSQTILEPGQILAYIEFEKDKPDTISFYRKIGTRKALSIAKASVAFKASKANGQLKNVNLAYGSVGPTVIQSKKAREFLEGKELNDDNIEKASLLAFNEVTPIDDIRSTAEYRRLVIKNVVVEELKQFL